MTEVARSACTSRVLTSRVLTLGPIPGGLNNQRMALLGLVVQAQLEGARVAIPATLADFTPQPGRPPSPLIAFNEVFELEVFKGFLDQAELLSGDEPNEVLDYMECFRIGNRNLPKLRKQWGSDSALIPGFLNALRPATHIQALADSAISQFNNTATAALQLRVERDWQEYLARRRAEGVAQHPFDDPTTDINRIFGKIASNPRFGRITRILICCDEDDLVTSPEEIIDIASQHGFSAVFKSQLPIDMPASRLQRSLVDFATCLGLSTYVGLTKSTFSNMLCVMKSLAIYPANPDHYIYNYASEMVARRFDRGLRLEPALAVQPLEVA